MGAEAAEQDALSRDLRRLTKTDPDPRVRRRAQTLLLVEQGQTLASAARLMGTAAHRLRIWQTRFAAEGRQGLVDRSRRGRPPALDAAARAFLEEALERGPQAYGLLVTIWSIRDLQALLEHERGITVSVCTLHRVVHALGYRYRRPRHDLRHRQDAEAVAAAKQVLTWLEKKALLSPNDPLLSASIWSISTSARSIPTPTWQKSGASRGSQ
jgi:transposase